MRPGEGDAVVSLAHLEREAPEEGEAEAEGSAEMVDEGVGSREDAADAAPAVEADSGLGADEA